MASGSLDAKEFNQYVVNYAHLLNTFLEQQSADQCEDDSDKAAFLGWSNHVKLELERHNSFVEQKLGLNPTIETALHPATAKYKEFLLATASGNVEVNETLTQQSKIPAYTLGAMTPSLRLYAFLSKEMQKLVSPYSRQSEQTLILPIYTKLDPEEERLMLFVDFDFTCISVASLEILANIEILSAQKSDQQLQGEDRDRYSQIASIDLRKTWELLSQQYTLENDNFKKEIMLGKKAVSFDYHGLHSAFEKLSSPEGQAVSRIFDSGVLKGISLEDIKHAGKCMELHNGCLNFFEKIALSSNLALCKVLVMRIGGLDMLKVDGNEFSYADEIFTGEVTRQAHQSVIAKVEYFEDMVVKNAHEHVPIPRSVFVTADIGIVIGSNKSLIKVGNHFGITFVPLYAGVVKEQKNCLDTGDPVVWRGSISGTLYTVTGWIEIEAFILGRDLVNEEL
ncbi:hypothetical protein MKW98_011828 [Papaver atlanticum]|uniref:Uncharacterized protein n=1 Tax=Papaver atlanticum TaxID=357466 RepID=A0AAD4SPK4_9MAGN|nr:hypothetical protein MKW98_011828 [Papaver atlanticum]